MASDCDPVRLEPSWKVVLGNELSKDYMVALHSYLLTQRSAGKVIFPSKEEVFSALNSTSFESTKVVILGQDPYHGEGQAHGLCFSVKAGVKVPPSLRNIYKELHADLGCLAPAHGNLMSWAKQGVLLLNCVLTVESGLAASHKGIGWEQFTDKVIESLNEQKKHLVFILWGNYAQKKGEMIDRSKHLVLSCSHPSPLSASRGYFGNHHFSMTNTYLQEHGSKPINWQLTEIV
ncbi:MAG: uracil-DNA glycosylase [Pseudohongiellaceae bacterium]|jgi:uracil-DNA glycosylase